MSRLPRPARSTFARAAHARASVARRILLLGLGALLGTGFQPLDWWPVALVGLTGFFWLSFGADRPRLRTALADGWWFGLGLGLVAISWVYVIGWYVVPPLLAFMALWQGLVAVVVALGQRLVPNRLLLAPVAAAAWSLSEYGASREPFGGFGWLRLAYTQVDSWLSGWLPVVGVGGLSFLLALGCALAAALLPQRASVRLRRGSRAARLVAGAGCLLVAVAAPLGGFVKPGTATGGDVTVGMVQGNVDGSAGPRAMGYARSVTDNHVSETVMLMARVRAGLERQPDFVLWPENSTDIDPTLDLQTRLLIERASAVTDLPILVGAVMAGPQVGQRQTSALWWPTDGQPGARYDKRNLVPFGEWIPLRDQLLPILPILKEVGAQSIPGTRPGVLPATLPDGRHVTLGDMICFELAWDNTVHDTVRHGAQALVVQSNNGTYTGTGQPVQQFAITRARAMEMRREIVVSTTNALSGLVHPDGSVSNVTQQATAAAHSYTVPLRTGVTPGVLLGPAIEATAAAAAALVALLALILPRLRRAPRVAGRPRD